MKQTFSIKQIAIAAVVAGVVFTSVSWQEKAAPQQRTLTDTTPTHKNRNIDEALIELEKAKAELDRSIKDIDFDKLNKELSTSIEKIHLDQDKMKVDLEKALKEIDMEKISKDLQQSLKEVDAAKIEAEVQGALSKVDWNKIQAEIKRTSQVELPKVKAELERIKDIDLRELETNLKKIQPELENSLKGARESLENMKVELKAYQSFIDRLEADGRIDKKADYTIQYKGGTLLINGKKQSDEVTTSYQWFLKGRKDFTIKKEADGFNINKD